MKKNMLIGFIIAALPFMLAFTPIGSLDSASDTPPAPNATPQGRRASDSALAGGGFNAQLAGTTLVLSTEQISDLEYMLEEEKLAHDVYTVLFEKWNLALFESIAASEQSHMDAIRNLFNCFDLEDPSEGLGFGQFKNADLQKLHDSLVLQGSQSLTEAIKVGAAIEEIDIVDLQERLTRTDQLEIQRVYENLLKGSENHLRAFSNAHYQQSGEEYRPKYLSSEEYRTILNITAGNMGSGRGGAFNSNGLRGRAN